MTLTAEHARAIADIAAAVTGLSAPAWVSALSEINVVLAFLTGVASLFFVLYRFWRYARAH